MAKFEVIEKQGLKMIRCELADEAVVAEAGALHYMLGQIEVKSEMPTAGGFLKSLVSSESIFRPSYTGTGTVFFGPPSLGEYMILEMRDEAWVLDRGAFVAASSGIEVGVYRNKALTGLMGEGMFQTQVKGTGTVVLQAQGPIEAVDLNQGRLAVDGNFAVARQAHLDYRVGRISKSMLGSMTSAEGLVSFIEGTGRVYLSPVPNLYVGLLAEIRSAMPMPKG
jgi:uncharacterized protein (AIM24 family)